MASGNGRVQFVLCCLLFREEPRRLKKRLSLSALSAEDEASLLVIVVDVNPIWWGQQAQREPEVVLGNAGVL